MRNLLLILFVLVAVVPAKGQGRYGSGKDSVECIQNLSFYTEYMKQGNIPEAAPLWRKAFNTCPPNSRQDLYTDGQKIMRHYISLNRRDPARQKELVDSLIMLYDRRLENFPDMRQSNKEQLKMNKASDIITHIKDDDMRVLVACEDAMKEAKERTRVVILVRYMDAAKNLYNDEKMSAEEVMDAYNNVMSYVDMIETAKPSKEISDAKGTIEALLLETGVANCDNLIALFTPQLESNRTNKDFLQKVVSMLNSAECIDSDLFVEALGELNNIEPSHNTAFLLYRLYSRREDNSTAVEYLKKAIDAEDSDSVQDGEYSLELANFYYQRIKNNIEAVATAKRAAQLNPNVAGKAYFLIGTIWGSTKCSGNEIEQRSPFWVAVDYLNKAKSADSSLASECNIMIANFSKFFPLQADAFMYDVLEGASYPVTTCGGLRETTTVRTQK